MSKFRGFIAIDIEVFPKLVNYEKDIKNSGADVKLVEPENVHITLKFLGDTKEEDIDKIEEIIRFCTSFLLYHSKSLFNSDGLL